MEPEPPQSRPYPPLPPGGPGSAAFAHDWAATPLGAMASWPAPLKTAAEIALGSNIPMFVAWGSELRLVHNDSYGEILGDRRPALGRPLAEVWADIWDAVEPNKERALRGETVYLESAPRPLKRHGRIETAWLTFCYSPIRDEQGEIAGIFGVVIAVSSDERTEQRLRESEERFRLIADSAPVPIWVTKLDRTRLAKRQCHHCGALCVAAGRCLWRTGVAFH